MQNGSVRGPVGSDGRGVHDVRGELIRGFSVPVPVLSLLSGKPETAFPKRALFGFKFLLVFVFATIPAGIYAKVHYSDILANVGLVARRCGEFVDDYELVDRAGNARRFERCRERGEGETRKRFDDECDDDSS